MGLLITLICIVLLMCVGLFLIWRFNKMESFVAILKLIGSKIKIFWKEVIAYPWYVLSHPVKGFTEMKTEKKGKMWVSIVILLLFVLEEIVAYKYMGIGSSNKINDQTKFSSINIIIFTILPVILITVSNWSVTTLMNGKGKMSEIFITICYSLLPFIMLSFIKILASNLLNTTDEAQFVTLINIVAIVLLVFMVFMGFVVTHEYGIFKTIGSIILTAVALCIILFIALLIFDLSQQIYGFVYSIYKEIATRLV